MEYGRENASQNVAIRKIVMKFVKNNNVDDKKLKRRYRIGRSKPNIEAVLKKIVKHQFVIVDSK